jgi:hypothetical protein
MDRVRGFLRYVAHVWKTAVTHSLGTADLWSGVIGAGIAVFVHFFPERRELMDALAWQIPLWALMTVVAGRLFLAPFWIYEEQAKRLAGYAERLTPRIRIFLNPATRGVSEATLSDGSPSKWVQIGVACLTHAALTNCEAWLTSFVRVGATRSKDLAQETVRCNWSGRDERKLQVRPGLPEYANLFSLYSMGLVKPELEPAKADLAKEVQTPGTYRGTIVVTADQVIPTEQAFEFDWRDFDHVTVRLL